VWNFPLTFHNEMKPQHERKSATSSHIHAQYLFTSISYNYSTYLRDYYIRSCIFHNSFHVIRIEYENKFFPSTLEMVLGGNSKKSFHYCFFVRYWHFFLNYCICNKINQFGGYNEVVWTKYMISNHSVRYHCF